MNAVERLDAAITKLETLRNEFMGEPLEWVVGEDDDGNLAIVGDPEDMNLGLFLFHPDGLLLNGQGGPDEDGLRAAESIVTLHRTIDAQLAILRRESKRLTHTVSWNAVTMPEWLVGREVSADDDTIWRWFETLSTPEQDKYRPAPDAEVIALADAILGGETNAPR